MDVLEGLLLAKAEATSRVSEGSSRKGRYPIHMKASAALAGIEEGRLIKVGSDTQYSFSCMLSLD